MDLQKYKEQLKRLDPIESLGRQYYRKHGRNLSYSQYMLLSRYTPSQMPSIEQLNSGEYMTDCYTIENQMHTKYHLDGLTEQDFIRADCDVEIEKLLRYVDIPEHRHEFMELVYVLFGVCYHTVGDQCYRQGRGTFTIINTSTHHALCASEDCVCLTIKVRAETFISFQTPNLPYFSVPICFHCGEDLFMENLLMSIYAQQEEEGCYHDSMISLMLRTLLVYCMQNYRETVLFLHEGTTEDRRMTEIFNYMFENYQSITMRELAQHFGYSEPYLCKLFRNKAGETFTGLLKRFRLEQAGKLLQSTPMKLDRICEEVGYADVTRFIRDFKVQYGITPGQYRKRKE